MKHFVNVTIQGADQGGPNAAQGFRVARLLEMETPKQDTPLLNSLAGHAQEYACKLAVERLSKVHPEHVFAWGHQESDGRTWLHGVAKKGVYRIV